jgi:hypothetical protein
MVKNEKSQCKVGRRKAVVLFDMTTGNCDMERRDCQSMTVVAPAQNTHTHIELPHSSIRAMNSLSSHPP